MDTDKEKRITFIVDCKVTNGDSVIWTTCFEREVPVDKVISISEVIEVLNELFCLCSHRVIVKSEQYEIQK